MGRIAAELFDLDGRAAFVTGAGQGVGREIALTMATNGAAVAVNDVRPELAEQVVEEIERDGGRAVAAIADVTRYRQVTAAFAKAAAELGPIDILVNNAGNAGAHRGLADRRPFWETEPEDWRDYIDVNLYGPLNTTRAAWQDLSRSGHGRIILIGSDAGRVGEPALAVYSAAKAAAAGFIRAIARAGGRYGITANCISLGVVDTHAASFLLDEPEQLRRTLDRYAIRRVGTPADAATFALYLASGAADWVTAQTLPVNGGYSSCL